MDLRLFVRAQFDVGVVPGVGIFNEHCVDFGREAGLFRLRVRVRVLV